MSDVLLQQLRAMRPNEKCGHWPKVAADEIERLRAACNPTCPGCERKPCNEDGTAVLWCDECVTEAADENERLRAIIEKARDE